LALANHVAAVVAFTDSIGQFRSLGDRAGEAVALDLRGTARLTRADTRAALEDLGHALAIRRQNGDRQGEAQTRSNLGLLLVAMDDDEGALEQNEQAWQLFRSVGNRSSEATVLHNLAEIHLRLGDGRRALEYGRMALDLHHEFGPASGVAHTLEHMASAYELLGDTQQASRHYELALNASRTLASRWIEAGVLSQLGVMHLAAGSGNDAAPYLTAAIEASRTVGNRLGEARVLVELGKVRALQGQHDEAARLLQQALSLSQSFESIRLQVHALAGLADLALLKGEPGTARVHSQAVLARLENLRTGADRDDFRTALSAAHDVHYRRHIDILMRLHGSEPDGGHAALAYQTAERARSRTLLETLASMRAPVTRGVPADLVAKDSQLRREIGAKADRLSRVLARSGSEAIAAPIRREIDALIAAYHETRSRIRAASPAHAALVHPDPVSLIDVQQSLLDDESVLLQYSLGATRSFVWAVTADRWMVAELPAREEIDSLTRRAYQLVTARSARGAGATPAARSRRIAAADLDWASLSRLLSRMVLAPVSPLLGKARVIVVGDGALDYLPFGALPDPTHANDAPLIVGHDVVRAPSASALAALRRHGRPAAAYKSVAVFADPVYGRADARVRTAAPIGPAEAAGPPRLRFSRTEAVDIAGLAGAGESSLVLDFDASRDALLSGNFARYDVLHLATHGTLDTHQPELSGLLLSTVDPDGQPREGLVRMPDIYTMPLDAGLVVLSGCETALGRTFRGEGLVGLTRGFLHAGASGVIASLWKVDDRATAELMRIMYRGLLRENLRPAQALRQAQLEVAREPSWSAPYYWAAFELSGDWR
jgi:CHAT domain-containing protein/tetratricopeptide (TPR) repeat protein